MSAVTDTFTRQSELLAQEALAHFDFSPQATLTLVNLSENVTFRVDDPVTGETCALRLHRPGYHDRQKIKSELLWLDALRAHRCVEVPPPISARNGERVVTVEGDDGPRLVSVAGWLDGATPAAGDELVASFGTLGETTAKLHAHAAIWQLPVGFCRPAWSQAEFFGAQPTLGPWRAGLGLDPEALAILERAETLVKLRLGGFSTGPADYGLIHADLRLANLLVGTRDDGEPVVRVIDFDDCGKGWLMYDFGSAVSFIEDDPRLPAMLASWTDAYRRVRPLGAEQEAQLATFVMLRRLVLVGWVARNHATATEAAALGAGFTAGACELAERYLSGTLAA